MLVDSHSHLFLEEFAEDLPFVMERARAAGVTHIFMPNIDSTTIEPMLIGFGLKGAFEEKVGIIQCLLFQSVSSIEPFLYMPQLFLL